MPPYTVATEKKSYQRKFQDLCDQFIKKNNSLLFLKKHTEIVDNLLIKLWRDSNVSEKNTLIAVGGYGRNELFPYSDVDILALTSEKSIENDENISQFITKCWDIGLKIGHSVRNLAEVKEEFNANISTATNLLEARLIYGSSDQYLKFNSTINKIINIKKFFKEKITEQAIRHRKYRDSAYQLEPNIKESPGGLRDLQMILWIATSQNKGNTFKELNQKEILSNDQFKKIRLTINKVNKYRILLHILSKSTDDRLTFDVQARLSKALGYQAKRNKKSSEVLMKNYYKSVNYIILLNEIILKKLDPKVSKIIQIKNQYPFTFSNNLIDIDREHISMIGKHVFEPFILLQKTKKALGFGANLLEALNGIGPTINEKFRNNKINQSKFIEIISGNDKVNRSLRLMNKCNILGNYIPAFGKVVAQMQHDLFHIYTVDEHTLNVIENIRRFSKASLKHEFPECHEIFLNFKKPYLLYLGAIFHDIAKGRGGDHSELGFDVAMKFCKKIDLPDNDTHLIAWLVKSHLKMSQIAQKSDISDPIVIHEFRELVKTQPYLDALYLLTVSDIRGTSPHVWNDWKASLLYDLFTSTKKSLNELHKSPDEIVGDRKKEVTKILSQYLIKKDHYNEFWQNLDLNYFIRFDANEIAWQTRLLMAHTDSIEPVVRIHHHKGSFIEILIYFKNRPSLFEKITNFFYENQLDILEAKIYTTSHDYALDIFHVMDDNNLNESYNQLFQHLEQGLTEIIPRKFESKEISLQKTRQAEHHDIQTVVNNKIINDTQFELEIITDSRPGLLNMISGEINKLNLEIDKARINTLGNRAEDFFLITSKKVQKDTIKKLKENILERLT
jgi:[protein-PII] uridylyltransferase